MVSSVTAWLRTASSAGLLVKHCQVQSAGLADKATLGAAAGCEKNRKITPQVAI